MQKNDLLPTLKILVSTSEEQSKRIRSLEFLQTFILDPQNESDVFSISSEALEYFHNLFIDRYNFSFELFGSIPFDDLGHL